MYSVASTKVEHITDKHICTLCNHTKTEVVFMSAAQCLSQTYSDRRFNTEILNTFRWTRQTFQTDEVDIFSRKIKHRYIQMAEVDILDNII